MKKSEHIMLVWLRKLVLAPHNLSVHVVVAGKGRSRAVLHLQK
jgi:hypothetical protein